MVPKDNPLTPEKIALGHQLFSDTRLSVNGTYSCATCHIPDQHFTDGKALAVGATGAQLPRNTPTLYNVAFNASFGWSDLGITELEDQHLIPLLSTAPIEMGFNQSQLDALNQDPALVGQFADAFGDPVAEISIDHIVAALASYIRTIRAPRSAFDRYLFFDRKDALSGLAQEGMTLFFAEEIGCATCHASLSFSGPVRHATQVAEPVFHNTGIDAEGAAFRAPTLRAIKHTAPYMHDGSIQTLEQVVQHYEQVDVERVPDFALNEQQRRALVAFLESL